MKTIVSTNQARNPIIIFSSSFPAWQHCPTDIQYLFANVMKMFYITAMAYKCIPQQNGRTSTYTGCKAEAL